MVAIDTLKPEVNLTMQVVDIPMEQIFSDSKFNIRGEIRMTDVVELARNINTHGLLQPITVQPYDKAPPAIYRIVLGHRRFEAHRYLQRETVPAIIKHGLTDVQALALNFNENVNRKDLNILEEAYGVQRFLDTGETVETIAKLVNKGKRWVSIRKDLLKMPTPIQQDAAAGWLTQDQILDLTEIHDPDEQMKIVKAIKEAKGRGEQRLPKINKKKTNPTKRRIRNRAEILDMIEHVIDETGVTNPFTRAWAWANGDISDLDLYRDMEEYFKAQDIAYSPPLEILELLRAYVPPPNGQE